MSRLKLTARSAALRWLGVTMAKLIFVSFLMTFSRGDRQDMDLKIR